MKEYILSIDLGTTSIRTILFDKDAQVVDIKQKEFTQYYPNPGWVCHDAQEIWDTLLTLLTMMFEKHDIAMVDSIGITNQRETTVLWNKDTGVPVNEAIVWQSRQSSDICEKLITEGYNDLFKSKTGLPIDAYFSATKIRWVIDNVSGVKHQIKADRLLFGTIDSWIIWKLTNKQVHVTDYSNASRTLLYNIFDLCWDEELLSILDVPKNILPDVVDSSKVVAYTDESIFCGHKIPIAGVAGDQQAALFGQGCFDVGLAKNTYGTGCFMLMNTGDIPIKPTNGLLTTIAWSIDNKVTYALEGSIFVAGSAVQWLRDGLKIIENTSDSEIYAKEVDSTSGVYVVPAFVGLGTPYWDNDAKGAIFGLTRGTTRSEIIRATLESICYQTKDVLDIMSKASKTSLLRLRVDGGATKNNFLMQFQSDILNVCVDVPIVNETTALGVAFLAGLATKFWSDTNEINDIITKNTTFTPKMDQNTRDELYKKWKVAINATRVFK